MSYLAFELDPSCSGKRGRAGDTERGGGERGGSMAMCSGEGRGEAVAGMGSGVSQPLHIKLSANLEDKLPGI